MVHIIEGETCPEVWFKACSYLLNEKAQNKYCDYNVILHVNSPLQAFSQRDQKIHDVVNDFLIKHSSRNLQTVAGTIFPASFYVSKNKSGVFEDYPKMFGKIVQGWGSYAYRMVKRKDEDGTYYNPLEKIIDKINTQPKYGKCHELGLLPFDADIQLYDPRKDRGRYYGGQCLSHISIKIVEKKVNITALYRNHFYIERLLGNLIGLAQLMSFIAKETNLEVGELIIHSTAAEIDTGKWNVTEVKSLVNGLSDIQKAA